MITEAIILAGGLGTRLRSAVPDLPKCMAPVAGRPFISYIIEYYKKQGIQRFVFSLGYKSEIIIDFINNNYEESDFVFSVEATPLGTGGAILKACRQSITNDVLVVNGDTFFGVDVASHATFHSEKKSDCSLCLKQIANSDRYGVVEIDSNGKIISFLEKKWYAKSLINGGVYALNKNAFLSLVLPDKFSFEKDYLERYYGKQPIYGLVHDGYFIDIGIPEDLQKAQVELKF